jgi:hypothetical protein
MIWGLREEKAKRRFERCVMRGWLCEKDCRWIEEIEKELLIVKQIVRGGKRNVTVKMIFER